MGELLDFLIRQPLILIFLAIWLLSSLGKLGQRAAKRVAEQQEAQRREDRAVRRQLSAEVRSAGPRAEPPEPRPQPTRRQRPSPDDIAAEIRRMMGMEPEARPPEPVVVREAELSEQAPPTPPRRLRVVRAVPSPEVEVATVRRSRPFAPSPLPSASDRMTARTSKHRHRLVDLSNPASAIVAMEVLGPPLALR